MTILVANRGEVALRIMRSAHKLGVPTVAIYTDTERDALHVRAAHKAVRIASDRYPSAYLDQEAILAACKLAGACAVHPGYGFLAENAEFAQRVNEAGLRWIGPTASSMRAMGDKAHAKQNLLKLGVPILPGYHDEQQDEPTLLAEGARIGFPLMIKAAAGGGGRGMRLVKELADLRQQLASARSEAEKAFGDGRLVLERALIAPRHIEVQILADHHGKVLHLGERDCSVQRRHQKLIEEAPSPAVSVELRERLGRAAVSIARACDYQGLGTVEFLLDQHGEFWFIEMNTRLQVEHGVTEAITDLDLVEWQLRVASGEPLLFSQQDIDQRLRTGGHAIEVRLCAEDADNDFLPQSGPVLVWQGPSSLRCDHGLERGAQVSTNFDSMLAKLIAHGSSREQARVRLQTGLSETVLLGVANNLDFLHHCIVQHEFIDGAATTAFLDTTIKDTIRETTFVAIAMSACLLRAGPYLNRPSTMGHRLGAWTNSLPLTQMLDMVLNEKNYRIECQTRQCKDGSSILSLRYDQDVIEVTDIDLAQEQIRITIGGRNWQAHYAQDGLQGYLQIGTRQYRFATAVLGKGLRGSTAGGDILAPMSARVVGVLVTEGDYVKTGQNLLILDAMKMEHVVRASCDGLVEKLAVAVGAQVNVGQCMLSLSARVDQTKDKFSERAA